MNLLDIFHKKTGTKFKVGDAVFPKIGYDYINKDRSFPKIIIKITKCEGTPGHLLHFRDGTATHELAVQLWS